MKIASPDILHKTEVAGIRLGLRDGDAVAQAAAEVLQSARRHRPEARLDGVSVQAMAPPGIELVLGLQCDAQFGPLVMVGLGGVQVELLGDVATALAPITPDHARRMLESLRGYRLLTGYRQQPAHDVAAAVDALCRFSELAADLAGLIEEGDVNPLIVGTAGAVAADALFVLAPAEAKGSPA